MSLLGRACASACFVALASPGWSAELPAEPRARSIQIVNETSLTIQVLYAYDSRTRPWLEDALGNRVIPAGQTIRLYLDQSDACLYTFQAILADNTELNYDRYDVCRNDSLHVKQRPDAQ